MTLDKIFFTNKAKAFICTNKLFTMNNLYKYLKFYENRFCEFSSNHLNLRKNTKKKQIHLFLLSANRFSVTKN